MGGFEGSLEVQAELRSTQLSHACRDLATGPPFYEGKADIHVDGQPLRWMAIEADMVDPQRLSHPKACPAEPSAWPHWFQFPGPRQRLSPAHDPATFSVPARRFRSWRLRGCGANLSPSLYVKRPSSLRPVEFGRPMATADRVELSDVDGQDARGLHRIGVKIPLSFRPGCGRSLRWLDSATSLFACMMDTRMVSSC